MIIQELLSSYQYQYQYDIAVLFSPHITFRLTVTELISSINETSWQTQTHCSIKNFDKRCGEESKSMLNLLKAREKNIVRL